MLRTWLVNKIVSFLWPNIWYNIELHFKKYIDGKITGQNEFMAENIAAMREYRENIKDEYKARKIDSEVRERHHTELMDVLKDIASAQWNAN